MTTSYPRRFEGKIALVTGANVGGIGGAVAMRLAHEGASLALLAQGEQTQLIEALRATGAQVVGAQGDVRESADAARFVAQAVERFGGTIHVLVNNAGVETSGSFRHLSDEAWAEVVETNLGGVMRVTRAALPHLKRGACIVNVASALGLVGSAGLAAYSASKGGVVSLTESLALELAPEGIRVVAVAPGLVTTPLVLKHIALVTPEALAAARAAHPLGLGRADDVAAAVAFLASDEARWITGVALPMGWVPALPLPTLGAPAENQRPARRPRK